MIEYCIEVSDAFDDISDAINERLKKGWELYGELKISVIGNDINKYEEWFYQPMIRKISND